PPRSILPVASAATVRSHPHLRRREGLKHRACQRRPHDFPPFPAPTPWRTPSFAPRSPPHAPAPPPPPATRNGRPTSPQTADPSCTVDPKISRPPTQPAAWIQTLWIHPTLRAVWIQTLWSRSTHRAAWIRKSSRPPDTACSVDPTPWIHSTHRA